MREFRVGRLLLLLPAILLCMAGYVGDVSSWWRLNPALAALQEQASDRLHPAAGMGSSPASLAAPMMAQPGRAANEQPWPLVVKELSLGVPAGNGYYPKRLALNPAKGRIYTLNSGTDETGSTISVVDARQGQVIAVYPLGVRGYDVGQLAVTPGDGMIYAVTLPTTPTLSIVAAASGQVVRQVEDVRAMAVDEGNGQLYLADSRTIRVLEIPGYRQLRQRALPTAEEAGFLALDARADRLYLCRRRRLEFYVASTLERVAAVPLDGPVDDLVADVMTGRLFAAYSPQVSRQEVLVFSGRDGRLLSTFAVSEKWGTGAIALDQAKGRVFATGSGETAAAVFAPFVAIFDASSGKRLGEIPVGTSLSSLAFDPASGLLYATSTYDHKLLILDPDRGEVVKTIYTAVDLKDVAVDPEAGRFYISDSAGRTRVFDTRSFAQVGAMEVGGYLAIDVPHGRLYAGEPPAGGKAEGIGVAVIDSRTLRLEGRIMPSGVPVADTTTGEVYIVNNGVYVANAGTLTVTGRISNTFSRPDTYVPNYYAVDAVVDSKNRLLYVIVNNGVPGSNNGNYLYTYDLVSGTQLLTDTERSVQSVAVDPGSKRAYVTRAFLGDQMSLSALVDGYRLAGRVEGIVGDLAVDPQRGRLYVCTRNKLWILDAATLDVLNAFPLDGSYYLADNDAPANRLYLIGSQGRLLVVAGEGGEPPAPELPEMVPSPAQPVNWLAISPDYGADQTIFGTWEHTPYRSVDGGQTCGRVGGGLPVGEWVNSLAFSPSFDQDGTLFAALSYGGLGGGVYKSTDHGLSWRLSSIGLTDLVVQEVAVSPDFPGDQTLFARTLRYGLFRSTDGGAHWTPLGDHYAEAPRDRPVAALALSPDYAHDQTIFIGVYGGSLKGLFRSSDGGETWQKLLPDYLDRLLLSPNYGADRTLFGILGSEGVRRSEDGGESWRAASLGLDLTQAAMKAIALSPNFTLNKTLYALVGPYDPAKKSQLYRSTDGARSWQELAGGPPEVPDASTLAVAQAAGEDLLFIGTTAGRIVKLPAARAHWSAPSVSLEMAEVDDLAISPAFAQDRTIFSVSGAAGLFVSRDGGTGWELTNFAGRSRLTHRFRLAISPAFATDGTIFVGTSSELQRSRDGGRSWQQLTGGLPPIFPVTTLAVSPDFARDRTVFAAGDYRAPFVYVSRDGGETWEKGAQGLPTDNSSGIAKVVVSPAYAKDNTAYAWVLYQGLFKTIDGGRTWARLLEQKGWYVQSLAISPGFAQDGTMFVGALDGQVFRSRDGGATWQELGTRLPPPSKVWITALALSPGFSRDGVLFIGTDIGVYRSDDGGDTWREASKGLPEGAKGGPVGVLSLAVSPSFVQDNTVFAGTLQGVYISNDGRTTWHVAGPAVRAPRATAIPSTSVATPTPIAATTLCPPIPVEFASLWEKRRDRLGCPAQGVVDTPMAGQPFQHGWMLWRQDSKLIYVLLEGGTWHSYDDTFAGEEEPKEYTPPASNLVTPVRGFGKVWRELLGGSTAAIGWGTAPEQGFTGHILACENGLIIKSDGGEAYLLYGDGGWEKW